MQRFFYCVLEKDNNIQESAVGVVDLSFILEIV